MSFKVANHYELEEGREYLFKDSRGCFFLGIYYDFDVNGFYTDSHDFIEMGRVCVVWELPNENS
ncbi:hypothetical protein AP1_0173 [Aeromonas phage AP1]|uniref:Uncharacterized protein n=2 Tax=Caudoviricetes TaxID=2731619 RepID=A0A291LDW5_9CAUD|nr:hypothetical protein [Aeromonas phage AS-szw]QAX98869.1 hypothetical protein assk_70 [Aeromonas phage Assk]QMV28880.1 hypothetical protein AP1_0173 [Aeromonas phage AP1]